jgi:hypothetical protein
LRTIDDSIIWLIEKGGRFSVKSVYNAVTNDDSIKIFLWLMSNDALLTKDNLKKRKWQGDPSCVFCDCEETISHLFFQCPVAKVIWVVVAKYFGASNIPMNLQQCWLWCEKWLPFGKEIPPMGCCSHLLGNMEE